jgi:hypothetical protein
MVLGGAVALAILVLVLVGIIARRSLRLFVRALWPH